MLAKKSKYGLMAGLFLITASLGAQASAMNQDPFTMILNFECPQTTSSSDSVHFLMNNGNKISGLGIEFANGKSLVDPLFEGQLVTGVPMSLTSYYRSGTDYHPDSSTVLCFYTSSANFPPFSVQYSIVKGDGGVIAYKTAKSITIKFTLGVKK